MGNHKFKPQLIANTRASTTCSTGSSRSQPPSQPPQPSSSPASTQKQPSQSIWNWHRTIKVTTLQLRSLVPHQQLRSLVLDGMLRSLVLHQQHRSPHNTTVRRELLETY